MKVIFLDFDGVLFDSVKEAYCVAMMTVHKARHVEDIDFDTDHFRLFSAHRYMVTSARSYCYLLKAVDACSATVGNVEAEYRRHAEIVSQQERDAFETRFYGVRARMKETTYRTWLSLCVPFPFFYALRDMINTHADQFYIVSTKDESTIRDLLKAHETRFFNEHIFGAVAYRKFGSKRAVIEHLITEKGMADTILVEDSYKHIKECRAIDGLKGFQPEWGYVPSGAETSSQDEILSAINRRITG